MAIATKNGRTVYSVAFALVTTDKNTVLNRNEAYAFADCRGCRAVAIAFQVVLIVGDAHAAAPQNLSAAVGYNCVQCVTQALAVQLAISLPGPPDATAATKLAALWARIRAFGAHLRGLSLQQIATQLTSYQKQVLQIFSTAATASSSASGSATPSASGSAAPTGSAAASASAAASGSNAAGAAAPGSASSSGLRQGPPDPSRSSAPSSAAATSSPAAGPTSP
jgi:putative peptide zinc metalloprotease protein